MAGKPELSSVTQQSQNHQSSQSQSQSQTQSQQSLQNVVVYVSNDNIAQAYAVAGQQNVTTNFHQQHQQNQNQTTPIQQQQQQQQQQNGAVVYANNTGQAILSPNQIANIPQTTNKTFNNNATKTQGILENGTIANNFYLQNGFPQNITYQNQHQTQTQLQNSIQIQNQNPNVATQINQNLHIHNQNVNVNVPSLGIQNQNIHQVPHIQNTNIGLPNHNQNSHNMQIHNQNVGISSIPVPNHQSLHSIGNQIQNQNANGNVNVNVSVPIPNLNLGLENPNHNQNVQNLGFNGVVGLNGTSEIFSLQSSDKQVLTSRSDQKLISQRDDQNSTESSSFISTDSTGYVVMSSNSNTENNHSVVFPRCESVRSETAESSCSSLSSGDSQTESVINQNNNHHNSLSLSLSTSSSSSSSDIVVYDNNGVSVNVRSTNNNNNNNLGNLVLTMVPQSSQQSSTSSLQQSQTQSQHIGVVNQVTIPFGWKRLVTNGIVLYISPSNTALSSLEQVKEYLMTEGTCKCGLECPFKYENVFNFDPKVMGKPYVISPDTNQGDLTKLCNHKRKLLAMSPVVGKPPTPVPALQLHIDPNKLRKDGGLKRKKRKVGPYAGVSVSQLLAQREKNQITMNQQQQQQPIPYKDSSPQQNSPQFVQQQQQQQQWSNSMVPNSSQNIRPNFPEGQINPQSPNIQQFVRYPNQGGTPINRIIPGSPGIVGNQQQMMVQQQQQPNQQMMYQQISQQGQPPQQQHPIIGQQQQQQQPNGQILVQQSGQVNHSGHPMIGIMPGNGNNVVIQGQHLPNQPRMSQPEIRSPNRMPPNASSIPQQEFGQRMQQQQQQFYGQNIPFQNMDQNKMIQQQQQQQQQQQGVRPNFIPNNGNLTFPGYRTDQQIQMGQNQQMIMVQSQNQQTMKNHWLQQQQQQQNKPGTPVQNIQQQVQVVPIQNMSPHSQNMSPHSQNISPHPQNISPHPQTMSPHPQTMSQQSISPHNQIQNPNPFERVPPLHHHTPPPPVWNEDLNKRKVKMSKSKKQRSYNDHHQQQQQQRYGNPSHESCPNVDVRQINQEKSMHQDNYHQSSPGPSFMEDPSGYLAQQTALLNSTISRQTGVCQNYMCHSPNMQSPVPGKNQQQYTNNRINVQSVQVVQKATNHEPNQNVPDSSATETYGNDNNNKKKNRATPYQGLGQSSGSEPSTPNSGFEDNPVTSSTFSEKYGQGGYVPSPDSRPIQGGTVSTSNGSPIDGQSSQSEPSSAPSTPTPVQQRNTDTPLMMSIGTNSVATSICTTSANNPNPNTMGKMEGYCPHPHAIGSPLGIPRISSTPYSSGDSSNMITITASGRTFGSNTITSVLAGRASTSTVSINAPTSIPTTFTSQTTGLISTAQNPTMTKSPLEMVQSVVSSIQLPNSQNNVVNTQLQQISPQQIVKSPQSLPPGHILVSSGGQLLMATTGGNQQQQHQNIMAPPPPKLNNTSPLQTPPNHQTSNPNHQMVTNVTASVTQVIPAVAQQVLGQQTVLVNALPTPFVIQPGVVTVDGMTVQQNMQIPHLVTGNVIQQQIHIDGNQDQNGARTPHHSPGFSRQPLALLSPESNNKNGNKKGKKRKMSSSQTVASMLHIASQQNSNLGFQQGSFQMAHSPSGIQGPMLQALTIVPGKPGVPSQIVMNGQQAGTGFAPQINAPQINLLQPVNLLNGTTGVVQNFPTIQQFIVPNLGGMVMTADGTLIQDQNIGMQLQLQNVNGQNVLTQVQNSNVFAAGGQSILAGTAGMVIRTPNGAQGKIIQQQHSPGAQFLSPNGGQFVMNGTQFNGQLSPLVANVSPTQQVTFSTSPQQVRPATSLPQEFIQCNQMGQTLMVPCTPVVTSAPNQQNTTYVQQNTTIVQQQTTMVSNNQIQNFGQNSAEQQNFIIGNTHTQEKNQPVQSTLILQRHSPKSLAMMQSRQSHQSVSTQTAAKQNIQTPSVTTNTFCQTSMSTSASSPPDTTTHSPLASGGQSPTNADTTTHSVGMGSTDEGLSPAPSNSSVTGNYTDTITIQGRQSSSMAMVHCVSSSEPDSGEICGTNQTEMDWSSQNNCISFKPEYEITRNDLDANHSVHISRKSETPTHNMAFVESSTVVSGMQLMSDSIKTQESIVSSRNYESRNNLKRKHADTLVIMETRHMQTTLQDDEENCVEPMTKEHNFCVGDVVWGAANGCQNWPGKIIRFNDENEKALVHWFGGDKSSSMVQITTLQTLTQGLDAHHRARKKCRKSRKLNPQLEKAIQEAMTELDRLGEKIEADKLPDKKANNLKSQTAKSR